MEIVPHVRKIAVLRANGIGDLMFALPALDALRAAYPHAEMTLLASDWQREFFAGRPAPIDRVVPIPPSRGVRVDAGRPEDPLELDRFFASMQRERFDLALQLHGGGRHSNPFVRRLGARVSAGLKTPDAVALDRSLPYVYFQPEIVRYVEVVGLVGARTDRLDPRVVVTRRDLEESTVCVPRSDRAFAVLHPSATDTKRRWPAPKFGLVGRALGRRGLDVYVVGVERDRAIVDAVVAESGGDERHNLCGRLSLNGLAGLLSRATLVVSNDSGPLHLANAAGARSVGIYWCGNLVTAAPVTRGRHRPVVSWRLDCPRCGASAIAGPCGHGDSFVADVTVEEVLAESQNLLEEIAGEMERPKGESRSVGARSVAPPERVGLEP